MKRTPVASSSLRSLGYDAAQQVLEVEFASGALYRYEQVAALPLPAHRMNGRRGG